MAGLMSAWRLLFATGALAVSILCMLALLGFASPWLDLLNHLQPVLFTGSLLAVILTPLVLRSGRARAFVLACVATGFVSSAISVVPELIAGIAPRPPLPSGAHTTVKVMTHNLFGLNDDMARVAKVTAAEQPDIIALQEFFPEQAADLHPLLAPSYPHWARCFGGKRANIAIYAKLPFEQSMNGACAPDPGAGARTAHLVARFAGPGNQPFTLVTTHLDWPIPVIRQQGEFTALAATVAGIEGPLFVVGDFNSTPWSYQLKRFAFENLLVRHTRTLPTYPLRFHILGEWRDTLPILPLDQVLSRGPVNVHELHGAEPTGSDHLPVVFSFSFEPPAP